MTNEMEATRSWPDLAIGLYDRLTGRNAEITYQLTDVEVHVPDRVGKDVVHTPWRVNGTVRIHTHG